MAYPEYIMRYLRQRDGLEEDDTSQDVRLNRLTKDDVFSEVIWWHGLIGGWPALIKRWIKDIYGVDLDGGEAK